MKKLATITLVLLGFAVTASAATMYVEVTTDKTVYVPGETVNWTINVWGDNDTRGIAGTAMDLLETSGDALNPADKEFYFGVIPGLANSEYSPANLYVLTRVGTAPTDPNELLDIYAFQNNESAKFDIGNDGVPHVFATGSYVISTLGTHMLVPENKGANYWDSDTAIRATRFDEVQEINAQFEVVPEPCTMLLLGTGLTGMLGFVRRRKMAH